MPCLALPCSALSLLQPQQWQQSFQEITEEQAAASAADRLAARRSEAARRASSAAADRPSSRTPLRQGETAEKLESARFELKQRSSSEGGARRPQEAEQPADSQQLPQQPAGGQIRVGRMPKACTLCRT